MNYKISYVAEGDERKYSNFALDIRLFAEANNLVYNNLDANKRVADSYKNTFFGRYNICARSITGLNDEGDIDMIVKTSNFIKERAKERGVKVPVFIISEDITEKTKEV